MKENKSSKKKVVKTVKTTKNKTSKKTISPTQRGNKLQAATSKYNQELLFEKQNFMLMGIGLLVIFFGFFLMSGGEMSNPNEWDPNKIYGFRRVTLAPIVVLIGLIIEIYAIFKR
ncbi:MAG: DUF3098 domain-containing protein [Bacteroidota bacterium]